MWEFHENVCTHCELQNEGTPPLEYICKGHHQSYHEAGCGKVKKCPGHADT